MQVTRYFNRAVPENAAYYQHNEEGSDDLPVQVKASILGAGLMAPIAHGKLNIGLRQEIYLCEHCNYGSCYLSPRRGDGFGGLLAVGDSIGGFRIMRY